ncbi:hypothetical protein M3J07_013910 [Ascochyta lentis]
MTALQLPDCASPDTPRTYQKTINASALVHKRALKMGSLCEIHRRSRRQIG